MSVFASEIIECNFITNYLSKYTDTQFVRFWIVYFLSANTRDVWIGIWALQHKAENHVFQVSVFRI